MPKGAKKGENRFKASQIAEVESRVRRFEEHVVPKMKAMCDLVHIANKTAFQKICAQVFNENLPVNMKEITHRAIATNTKYWSIVGAVYHFYYDANNSKSLYDLKNEAVITLGNKEKIDKMEQEIRKIKKRK
ncbi:hypothetical protein [Vibrio fluvialis]|uniref:hypothetical protein n=1 Tax=Vibrio fluvialis TaxID=676 RepID=UPI0028F746EC|nr:hypothetical protein [Vibrio fluvialis]